MKELLEAPRVETRQTNGTGRRTIYVHHCSGLVTEVCDVTEIHVTQTQLVLVRAGAPAAVFPRSDVYFASSERDEQPAPC